MDYTLVRHSSCNSYPSRGKGIIGRVLKICRIYHSSLQNLVWEYFWPHLEKQDGSHRCMLTFSKEFCCHSGAKGIVGRDVSS